MSNDKEEIARLYKLQAKINMMVVDGTRNPKSVADTLQQILEEKQQYLRHLETLTLAPTKGNVTLAEAGDVFTGWIDGAFDNWGTDVEGKDTAETKVNVHEMTRDGNYNTLFGSLGDPRKLCLTQGQIVEFCRSHRDSLQQGGFATFFLFEVKGELIVVNVRVGGGKLSGRVFHFDHARVWLANCHRLVVKQQTT